MTTTYNTHIGTIIVERCGSAYTAMIADRKTQWGSGKTVLEAVGGLLVTHFSVGE